eukprot:1596349-Prymnesium_polylepis.1
MFDALRVSIVLTSRPAAITALRERLAGMGFEARRIVELTENKTDELSERVLSRLCIEGEAAARLQAELRRPEYASLVRVPITLTLLIHVLHHTLALEVIKAEQGLAEDNFSRSCQQFYHGDFDNP